MLNFVIGSAGTGKTTYINNQILSLAKDGKKCILLVPEQFSKTGEAQLFSSLEQTQLNLVRLFSFSSLLRDVQNDYQKLPGTPILPQGKAVMARRAAESVKKQLSIYSSKSFSLEFSFQLAGAFDELKRSGVDSAVFYSLAGKAPQKNAKLKELSLIYAEYCGLMGNRFCDSEDLLSLLAEMLPEEYTHDTHIFIDSFESFSYGQYKLIQRFMNKAESVTIALAADSLFDSTGGTGNFSFVQQTASQLISLAKKNNTQVSKPVVLSENHRFKNAQLKNVDLFLQGKPTSDADEDTVFITEFENQALEVSFVCAQIHKLIQQGYTYNDIAIICPQPEKYENQLQESLTLADIPYFIDQNRIITSSSPVQLFKSVFEIMSKGLSAQTVLSLLKTRLTEFSAEDISLLENYFFVWQDYSFDFSVPFEFSPSGLKARPDDEELPVLERMNQMRSKLWDIFGSFIYKNQSVSGEKLLLKAYEIVTALDCQSRLSEFIKEIAMTSEEASRLLLRQWETVTDCLDQLYTIIGGDSLTVGDCQSLFMLMASGAQIGIAPQTQDCVIVSDPKRMKLEAIKVAFIVGAAQDIFPALVSEDGIISSADRDYLKAKDYPLKSNFENLFSFENLYFYKALTSAENLLFISCAKKNVDTKQLLSAEIENLRQGLRLPAAALPLEDYAVNKAFFTDYLSEISTASTRKEYLNILSSLNVFVDTAFEKAFSIADLQYLAQLLGQSITISPTAAERYFQCAFMYFLDRILKLKVPKKAQLSAQIAGNYLHYIVQKVMEKYGEEFYKASKEDISLTIESAVDGFISENYPKEIYESPQFSSQHENMRENAVQLIDYIHTEQENALFRPIAFEEKIGMGSSVPALSIKTDDGHSINIVGVCDRVDVFHGENADYLRIVDYKTGTKKFDLDDIYNGLSTQLLLYMSALINADFKGMKNLKPGAVMYQPSDAAFKFDKDGEGLYTAVGMALANSDIAKAFDTEGLGRFGVIKGEDKQKSLTDSEIVGEKKFALILDYAQDKLRSMAQNVYEGQFDSDPLAKGAEDSPCRWCDYKAVCQNSDKSHPPLKNNFKELEKEE